jgi:hypothetical protein
MAQRPPSRFKRVDCLADAGNMKVCGIPQLETNCDVQRRDWKAHASEKSREMQDPPVDFRK